MTATKSIVKESSHSVNNLGDQPERPIHIILNPLPLPADFQSRLARIYALALELGRDSTPDESPPNPPDRDGDA